MATDNRNMCCCDCLLPWKSCLSGCCLDTDLRKRYLVIEVLNMWEVSTGGSHKIMDITQIISDTSIGMKNILN
jgi:hypothetical protein